MLCDLNYSQIPYGVYQPDEDSFFLLDTTVYDIELNYQKEYQQYQFIEIGCGSGAVLLSTIQAMKEKLNIIPIISDINKDAIEYSQKLYKENDQKCIAYNCEYFSDIINVQDKKVILINNPPYLTEMITQIDSRIDISLVGGLSWLKEFYTKLFQWIQKEKIEQLIIYQVVMKIYYEQLKEVILENQKKRQCTIDIDIITQKQLPSEFLYGIKIYISSKKITSKNKNTDKSTNKKD